MQPPMVQYLTASYGLSVRRACRVLPLARSTYKYQSRAPQHTALRQRIRDLALSRVGWGYRRLTTVLQREGWSVGRKLVYRLYREENLLLRPKKRRRRVSHQARVLQSTPHQLNEQWSMDFMSDALVDGRRIRVLTIVDDFSRESVYIGVGSHFRGIQVAQTLASVARRDLHRRKLESIMVQNSPRSRWTNGRIGMRSNWSSRDRLPRRITRTSSRLMRVCGRSASMPIGLNRSRRHEVKSGCGSINITSNTLTVRWAI